MKKALYYEAIKNTQNVKCVLCPWNCVISPDKSGFCRVRKNIKGVLYSMVYSRPISVAIDPIEKKPIFHFLPGTEAFSLGTVGCNLRCLHCQNYETSQESADDLPGEDMSPDAIVKMALDRGCSSIAYTYNEPTIFFEYVLDTAKLARKKGMGNVMVSNGYINPEPLKELYQYIDAVNIDLKGFNKDFYKKVCGVKLENVLRTLKLIAKMKNVLLEITNLVIPTKNDDLEEIEEMCKWLRDNVGKQVPLHFSRFFPYYKLSDLPQTDPAILEKAYKIGRKYMDYVYVGNLRTKTMENTYCPGCGEVIIERTGHFIPKNKLRESKGKCTKCGHAIAGVWE